jgi:LmbE family N-acetylglucosaminyl deacetylase
MSAGGILGVFAHPDDEVLLAGGLIAAAAAAGNRVALLSLTSGEAGSDASGSSEPLGSTRRSEHACAARVLGAATFDCLDQPDGSLDLIERDDLTSAIARLVQEVGASIVITFARDGWYWHQDHVAVHDAVMRLPSSGPAAVSVAYGVTWPSGRMARLLGAAQRLGAGTGLWGLDAKDFGAADDAIGWIADVSAFLETKRSALACYRSQFGTGHLFAEPLSKAAMVGLRREFLVPLRGDPERDTFLASLSESGLNLRRTSYRA